MKIKMNRKVAAKSAVKCRRVMADTDVAPEASELLFEAEDVADLVSEVTGEDVDVTADDTSVTFDIGEDSYVVEAEGTEDAVESCTTITRKKKAVSASTNRRAGRQIKCVARRK